MTTSKQFATRKRNGQRAAAQNNPKGKGARKTKRRRRVRVLLHDVERLAMYWEDRKATAATELAMAVAETFQVERVR